MFLSGFTGLKLYFMIGLPGEDDDGAAAIADMAAVAATQARAIAKGRARLSVSVSSYVPKAHTPFERESFAGEADASAAASSSSVRAMPRGVKLSFHDIGASVVEATLARSGAEAARSRRSGVAPRRALRRLDGALRSRARWRAAAEEVGIDLGAEDRGAARSAAVGGRRQRRRAGVPGRGTRPRRASRTHRRLPARSSAAPVACVMTTSKWRSWRDGR